MVAEVLVVALESGGVGVGWEDEAREECVEGLRAVVAVEKVLFVGLALEEELPR